MVQAVEVNQVAGRVLQPVFPDVLDQVAMENGQLAVLNISKLMEHENEDSWSMI